MFYNNIIKDVQMFHLHFQNKTILPYSPATYLANEMRSVFFVMRLITRIANAVYAFGET